MKKLLLPLFALMMIFALSAAAQDKDRVDDKGQPVSKHREDVLKRLNDAGKDLTELTAAGDKGIPDTVLKNAKCVAVIPDMVKGGFIIGAQHGRGIATCRTGNGWTAPAFFTLTGGSWGAQIGGESVDLVMLFMNDKGVNQLLESNWKIGGEGSVAAGPVGRDASASTDWKLRAQVLTYSRTRGLFAGLTLNGANVREDDDSTKAFYGKDYDFRTILTGKVATPPAAREFISSVRQNFHEANAAE